MNASHEILQSWQANAETWIATIDANEIESRKLVTNAAIIDAITNYRPEFVLDIGCGEGWLTRALAAKNIKGIGVDAIPELIQNAIKKGGEHYEVCSYENIIAGKCNVIPSVDAAVINFALLDKDLSEKLIQYLAKHLKKGSHLFIQTLHPFNITPYETGWKEGSWNGLQREFVQPYKWYFRTMQDWMQLFVEAGLRLTQLIEPIHPITEKPASVIFVLEVKTHS